MDGNGGTSSERLKALEGSLQRCKAELKELDEVQRERKGRDPRRHVKLLAIEDTRRQVEIVEARMATLQDKVDKIKAAQQDHVQRLRDKETEDRARAQLCEPTKFSIAAYASITYDAFWPASITISVQLAYCILALNHVIARYNAYNTRRAE